MDNRIIKIRGLEKAFGEKRVLRGVDLDVYKGETLCIIGRSGIGKSVLIKHIISLLTPDNGSIECYSQDISSYKIKELYALRKRIGMLFQFGALFDSMNVYDNLALPLREHTKLTESEIKLRIEEKLAMVGMPGVEMLHTSELSGGMKKRVGLARTIILEPEVVMYDEPTTGLDPIMSDTINKLIIGLKKKLNITSIVITHDMNSVYAIADRIAMIEDGKIIFTGTVEEIKRSGNLTVHNFINGISG